VVEESVENQPEGEVHEFNFKQETRPARSEVKEPAGSKFVPIKLIAQDER
jgi:hypothetical protein